ncbi:MAG TPA: hypothetical protein VFX09_01440, partial [Burkholderiales bacterium]|nr:hypothetical protein [Burkholderiales bacterium]
QSVYAVVVATQNLAPPLPENSYQSGPVTLRMDENAPWDDNWHFNGKFALAINRGNTRSLTRLLDKLADAKTFTIEMKPVGKGEIGASFHVAGTKDAVAKVFASCKDTDPLASGAAG